MQFLIPVLRSSGCAIPMNDVIGRFANPRGGFRVIDGYVGKIRSYAYHRRVETLCSARVVVYQKPLCCVCAYNLCVAHAHWSLTICTKFFDIKISLCQFRVVSCVVCFSWRFSGTRFLRRLPYLIDICIFHFNF